jgi:hypothetical protein
MGEVGEVPENIAPTKKKNKREVITAAEKIILTPTPLITDKDITPPSEDKRDFVSLSPYWYRTESGGLEVRDGEVNPEVQRYSDPQRLSEATRNIFVTTLAATSSEDETDKEKYAQYAVSTLNAWFIDEETRMTPSLEYAQMKIGENAGNHWGIIEGTGLVRVVESINQLKEDSLIDEETQKGVEGWFEQYLEWLRDSDEGKRQKDMPNNHGTFYDVQVAYVADFLGKEEITREAIGSTKQRIGTQITPEGEMPHETKRTIPYDYQLFNLYGMSEMANLADKYDVDLWNYETEDGRGLKKAFEYFTNQLDETKSNPFKMNRSGELHFTYRSASKAYGNEQYWDLPDKFYTDPLVDEVTTDMIKQN